MSSWAMETDAYAWTVWGRHAVRGLVVAGDIRMSWKGGSPVYVATSSRSEIYGDVVGSYKTKRAAVAALKRDLERETAEVSA